MTDISYFRSSSTEMKNNADERKVCIKWTQKIWH